MPYPKELYSTVRNQVTMGGFELEYAVRLVIP